MPIYTSTVSGSSYTSSIESGIGFRGTASIALTASVALNASGAVTSYTNGASTRVLTSTGADSINAESNLTFNGTLLQGAVSTAFRPGTGSLALTALGPNGDSNTGLYFPLADTIGFVEGGAEAMRLDSSGNLGIGTTSPSEKLHVVGFGKFQTSGDSLIDIVSTNASGTTWRLAQTVSSGTAGRFSIAEVGVASHLTILKGGNVGIGTTSPAARLHVAQSSSAVIFSQDSTTATIVGTNAAGNASQGLFLRGFPLTFTGNGGGGAEQMRLDASGNLGIGTTSPTYRLVVSNNGGVGGEFDANGTILAGGFGIQAYNRSTSAYVPLGLYGSSINLGATTTVNGYIVFKDSVNSNTYGFRGLSGIITADGGAQYPTGWNFQYGGSSNSGLYINSSGNVGIGTTAPERILELKAGEPYLRFNPTSVSGAYIIGAADGKLYFTPEATYSATMTLSSGNVGIGTTSPDQALHVVGDINATVGYRVNNGATSGQYLRGNGTRFVPGTIDAGDIAGGTLGVARGGTGVATITGIIKGNGTSAFSAAVAGTDYLTPTGNGSGLTNLNASNISSGTLADARLSANVPLLNATTNAFTGAVTWLSANSTDLDTHGTTALRQVVPFSSQFQPLNRPTSANYWAGFSFRQNLSNTYVTQLAVGTTDSNTLATRYYNNTSWSSWVLYLNSSNYNNYSPTLTGTGASGTWGISITGNAGSASSVAWTNVSGRPTALSSFTNDSGYITGAYLDDYTRGNYRVIADYASNTTWYIRNSSQRFVWARGHDWTVSFELDITGGTSGANNGWAVFGQQTSNNANGTWRGVRFSQYASSAAIDGDVRARRYYLNDDTNYITLGGAGAIRSQTSTGFVDIGSMNSSWVHFQTDRPRFYFGTSVTVDGDLQRYSDSALYLHSANYNSYAPTLTGGGASGTWGISITGNAATVTNGVYTTTISSYATTAVTAGSGLTGGGTVGSLTLNVGAGSGISVAADSVAVDSTVLRTTGAQDSSGNKRFRNTAGYLANASSVEDGLSVYQPTPGTDAVISFHISGDYAGHFGLGGAENDLIWTGWSVGSTRHRILHSNNVASFATTGVTAGSGLTGGGTVGALTLNIGAGTGIDVLADSIAVDVSDFMTNGVDNRIVTATGADGMNAESNLTFNGSTLAVTGAITATGEITAFSSDRRLKTNINPIQGALTKIKALSGFIYNWNKLANEKAGFNMEKTHVGVFAQDVQSVLPEAVRLAPFDNDGNDQSISGQNYLTVQYEKLVPLLIEAIKEQQEQIDELKRLLEDK